MLPLPAIASGPAIFAATLSETVNGFKNLATCETVLRGPDKHDDKALAERPGGQRGSLFNRTQGNVSRCEMVQGEAVIVVYPKGYAGKIIRR